MLFKDLSMQVEAGERIAIIGPNGAGKTTLLRCMYGDLTPDSGFHQMGGAGGAWLLRAGSQCRF